MKTNLKPVVLALGLGLLLLAPQTSSGYYNPSTGRWLSRDSDEEEGGLNVFAFCDNDGVASVDPIGLRTLRIVVGQDRTLRNDWNYENKVKHVNEELRKRLEDTLRRCIEWCEHEPPKVILVAMSGRVFLPAPKNRHWTVGSAEDEALMERNWKRITPAEKGAVPVFWTKHEIIGSKEKSAAGVGYHHKGIILSFDHWFPIYTLLAHEVGHFAGYSGGDRDNGSHSSNPQNVMSYGPGGDPDHDYCEKVIALAR